MMTFGEALATLVFLRFLQSACDARPERQRPHAAVRRSAVRAGHIQRRLTRLSARAAPATEGFLLLQG